MVTFFVSNSNLGRSKVTSSSSKALAKGSHHNIHIRGTDSVELTDTPSSPPHGTNTVGLVQVEIRLGDRYGQANALTDTDIVVEERVTENGNYDKNPLDYSGSGPAFPQSTVRPMLSRLFDRIGSGQCSDRH